MATFKVVDAIPLPPEYQTFECSKCEDWFVWPKKDYIKSEAKPRFCPHCGVKFEQKQ